ncbi:hypothetical protein [Achromobacter deleyi]|uniref:hypothetical protein n=1 Tax=Achromobacter deleyi TaxID=1353891 RepID=UPI001493125B|nr:hypothetical protein [Achromobacter deleyi]QVQ27620.1 hypothetical protein HLG70_03995 [Achromobacter deleyi]UIP23218.1 hypothetical protein LYZ39_12105 [Achromobacter deleyi]
MPTPDNIRWFKSQFHGPIDAAVAGTPLTVDFMTALACQETGQIWSALRKAGLSVSEILRLCVGDTLDADRGRSAFPKTKTDLLGVAQGKEMFDLAHQALVDMAQYVPGYAAVAKKPNKFCHGFGIFQLDLQFFKTEPEFFLNGLYADFGTALNRCLKELRSAAKRLGYDGRTDLDDLELTAIAIAYNTGGYKPAKGLKQGYFDGEKYYGETFFDFLRLCHTVGTTGTPAVLRAPAAGEAAVAPVAALAGAGIALKVQTKEGMLRLRSDPWISEPPQANVLANLPDGHPVRAFSERAKGGFLEIETSLSGAYFRGYSSRKFLVADSDYQEIPVAVPESSPPSVGIVAVHMPRKSGVVTRRTAPANAHTLNEPQQPSRTGGTAEELRLSLGAIIEWLDAENPAHQRYQPRAGLTFCNIYAHDFCHLAGAYIPRVWWTPRALLQLAAQQQVAPLYGSTIQEMRANDLFRWLRDFGLQFGWRQIGTLTGLQTEVNQGALGIIVARRKEDGRSGHIVMVVPETSDKTAKRNADGAVEAPLQSQAGATNFRYGRGKANWWNGSEFAESAFWIHA